MGKKENTDASKRPKRAVAVGIIMPKNDEKIYTVPLDVILEMKKHPLNKEKTLWIDWDKNGLPFLINKESSGPNALSVLQSGYFTPRRLLDAFYPAEVPRAPRAPRARAPLEIGPHSCRVELFPPLQPEEE